MGAAVSKAADAFRTISEVAEELDLHKHVLRFWEVKFPQIKPMKRGGGRRYYRPSDLELLRGIRHLLHSEGYTIKGVQRIIREKGIDAVKRVSAEGEIRAAGEAGQAAPSRSAAAGGKAAAAASAAQAEGAQAAAGRGGRAPAERPASRIVEAAIDVAARARMPAARGKEAEAPHKLSASQRQVVLAALAELRACRDVLVGGGGAGAQSKRISG